MKRRSVSFVLPGEKDCSPFHSIRSSRKERGFSSIPELVDISEKIETNDYSISEEISFEDISFENLPKRVLNQQRLDNSTNDQFNKVCVQTLTSILNSKFQTIEQLDQLYQCKIHLCMKQEENAPFSKTEIKGIFDLADEIALSLEYYHMNLLDILYNWQNHNNFLKIFEDTLGILPLFHAYAENMKNVQKLIIRKGGDEIVNELVKKEIPNLSYTFTDLIDFPMVMRSKIIYGLQQLISYIPPDSKHYKKLKRVWKSVTLKQDARQPFGNITGYPLKTGYAIQIVKKKRYLRYLFLFPNNIIVTSLTKKEPVGVFYECVDVIRLGKNMNNIVKSVNESDQMWPEVQSLLKVFRWYKSQLRNSTKRQNIIFGPLVEVKRKLLERAAHKVELSILMLVPSLRLSLQDVVNQRVYHFLFASHFELESWKSLIEKNDYPYNELAVLLKCVKNFCKIPRITTLQENMTNSFSYLNGTLEVHIHQVREFETEIEAFITLQVDSFGGYYDKVFSTSVSQLGSSPIFDEIFNIPLICSQNLKICFYKRNLLSEEFKLFSTGIFNIWNESLTGDHRLVLFPLFMQDTLNEKIVPNISNPNDSFYSNTSHQKTVLAVTLRLLSETNSEEPEKFHIFGKPIIETIRQEKRRIPLIVTICLEEIEEKGLDNNLLYMKKGNILNVYRLYKEFDKDSKNAEKYLRKNAFSVYDIIELLLWYLKTIPMSILQFPRTFLSLHGTMDDTRKEIGLKSLINKLSRENSDLFFHLLDHFVKVINHSGNSVTPKLAGKVLCSIFYDIERPKMTSQCRNLQNKFCEVMEYTIDLRIKGIV